jgi:hypothetical protein
MVYVDEVYANGDGADSWCSTDNDLPVNIYRSSFYDPPSCGSRSCVIINKIEYLEINVVPNCALSHKFDSGSGMYCTAKD